jgi:uncharacterized membrane protein YbhN (UPF0104 family)
MPSPVSSPFPSAGPLPPWWWSGSWTAWPSSSSCLWPWRLLASLRSCPPLSLLWGGVIQGVTVILGVLLASMILLLVFPRPFVRVAERVARFLPEKLSRLLVDSLESFLDGLRVFQSPRLLSMAVAWSLVVWAWQSLAFWVALRAFGIDVGYDTALFVNATVGFMVGIPAAPGFFGTFHAGARMGLAVYGVAAAPTLAFAFGFHLGGFFPVTFIGLYYAWKLGFSFKEMGTSEEKVEKAVEEAHPELKRPDGRGGHQ